MADTLSNWIIACTAGETIDGRKIAPKVIEEIVYNYDPSVKQAGINWDHDHNEKRVHYGEVAETKMTQMVTATS